VLADDHAFEPAVLLLIGLQHATLVLPADDCFEFGKRQRKSEPDRDRPI
jgi:hypothetical protein